VPRRDREADFQEVAKVLDRDGGRLIRHTPRLEQKQNIMQA
jgi:hypothetical protein